MPELRDVRQNARDVIHRSTDTQGRRHTVCGEELVHLAANPRVWQGGQQRELRECPTCFAPEATDDEIKPGDLVTLGNNTMGNLPSNPRDWHEGKVYVYVGPAPHYQNRSTILCEDGWLIRENADRMPLASVDADLGTARLEAWSCQTPLMQHAPPGTDADEVLLPRIRRARNRLLALRPEVGTPEPNAVRLCERGNDSGHPDYPHCHTTHDAPLWGDPTSPNVAGREMYPDGSYVLYAKGRHAPTTTERETTPVPPEQPAHEYPVGTDIYPLDNRHLRALGPGSVVTVVSSHRGVEHGNRIQFGCKEFTHQSLRDAQATVKYTARGVQCEADITLDGTVDYLLMAGQRISTGELRDYATSVIVKEIVERPAENALVMEYGFYGCAVHPEEVIFVGNGHPRGREPVAPVVGKVYPLNGGIHNRQTGTVGQASGMTQTTLADCTPVVSATTAHTMRLTRNRTWALVPAPAAMIARVQALRDYRCRVATTTSEVALPCTADGTPSVVPAPAMADASPF